MTNEGQLPSDLFMDLDRSGPMPLYFQVASRIEEAIRSGAMPPGARLENEIALGERLGLSRPTIRRAIQDLVYDAGRREPFLDTGKEGRPGVSRAWFNALYQVLLGQPEGPRFGSFVALYGIPGTVGLIETALARESA